MNPLPTESDVNSYINDPESGAEMARLLDQDRTVTNAMGGLLPELGSGGRYKMNNDSIRKDAGQSKIPGECHLHRNGRPGTI